MGTLVTGEALGMRVGPNVGTNEGTLVTGEVEGPRLGAVVVGDNVGTKVGANVSVGIIVGANVGTPLPSMIVHDVLAVMFIRPSTSSHTVPLSLTLYATATVTVLPPMFTSCLICTVPL